MTPRTRSRLASGLLLLPLAVGVGTLARDLGRRPGAMVPVHATAAGTSLRAGDALTVSLAPTTRTYRAIVVTPRVDGTPAHLTATACARPGACRTTSFGLADAEPIWFPLPAGVRGGEVTVTIDGARGPPVAMRSGPDGGPALTAVEGYSWALPMGRARAFVRAATGTDALPVALAVHGLVLLPVLGLALVAALGRRRGASPAAADRAPDRRRERDAHAG